MQAAAIRVDGNEEDRHGPVCPPQQLADWAREHLDSVARRRLQTFLASAPASQGLDLGPELAAELATIRDLLRDPLPAAEADPERPAATLASVIAVDRCGFWLTGTVDAEVATSLRLTAVSPEGSRSVVSPKAITLSAPAARFEGGDGPEQREFHAYVELDTPSLHPDGWMLEVRTPGGRESDARCASPVVTETSELMQWIHRQLTDPLDTGRLEQQILPTLRRRRHGHYAASIDAVFDLGTAPAEPDVSVVVAVKRIEQIQHQLAAYVEDPNTHEAELLFVVPDSQQLTTFAEELHDLYGLPFRVARLSARTRRQRALNLGANVARGRLLVLMSADVVPAAPGWLEQLRALYDSSPQIAVVGPKLIHEDESISQAGITYEPTHDGTMSWTRKTRYAGLWRGIAPALVPRRVDAVSDVCVAVAATAFRRARGFCELYLGDGDEGPDLCLTIREIEGETWYCPSAELFLLDRTEDSGSSSQARDRFNEWTFRRRHAAHLAAREEPSPPSPPSGSAPFPPVIPTSGSGRPGTPIESLEVITADLDGGAALDASLVVPQGETRGHQPLYRGTYSLAMAGWVVSRDGRALTVEVSSVDGQIQAASPATLASPAARAKHPGVPGADHSGFQVVLGSLPLRLEFELAVDAVDADGTRSRLGVIRGRRRRLRSAYRPVIQPLLVTMLGRTGSNWLISLMNSRPEVVTLRPFVYEPMLASYWMSVLRTLTDPASYMQALQPELYEHDWWTGHGRRSPLPMHKPVSEMAQWLGSAGVEALAGFCQSRLDDFYLRLAQAGNEAPPSYFVEKCPPGTGDLISEIYPEAREIILVRDLRDRVCSIVDYNSKRGLQLWGQDRAQDDKEWFALMRDEALALLENWERRHDRVHLVRYEDLILAPETTLEGIFEYLKIESTVQTIADTLTRASETRPHAQQEHRTANSFKESVGRWKQDLTPERQGLCAEAFDDILVRFGYEPTRVNVPSESRTD